MNTPIRAKTFFINVLGLAVVVACLALLPKASAAVNGNIILQRGSAAAYDIPFNRGGKLYRADPASGNETLFGNGSQPNYSLDGTKLAFIDSAHLFFASSGDYSTAKGLVLPDGGTAEVGLYPKVAPYNTQVLFQKPTTVSGTSIYHTYIINAQCILDGDQYRDASKCNETQLNLGGTSASIHPAWYPFPDAVVPNKWKHLFVRTSADRAAVDAGNYTGDIFKEDITIASNGVVTEGSKTNLTNSTAKYSFPTYSPDGRYIIFGKDDGLWLMKADGTGTPSQIQHNNAGTLGPLSGNHPAWSPDGKKIALDYFGVIYTMDLAIAADATATASNVNGLPTTEFFSDMYPSWQAVPGGSPPPPSATLSFDGRLRDRVSRSDGSAGLNTDGDPDGTFTITLPSGNASKSMTTLYVVGPNGASWDTVPNNTPILLWVVGISDSLDGQLLNSADGSINFQVGNPGIFKLFISDPNPSVFVQGNTFTVTVTFSDTSVAVGSVTIGQIPTTDLGLYMSAENETGGRLTGSVAAGQPFRYHAVVTNYGPSTATGVIIYVTLPSGVAFDGNDSANPTACSQSSGGSPVICRVSTALGTTPQASNVFGLIFYVRTTQAASFNTTATVYSDLTEPTPDPHPNTFTVNTTTNTATDLALSVVGDSDPVQVDAPLIYTATLKNNGPLTAPNAKADFLIDDNAAYVIYQNTSRSCAYSSRHVICSVGNMNSGAELTLTFQVRPRTVKNNFILIGNASSDIFDPNPLNNTNITLTTTVVPNAVPPNDDFPSDLRQLASYLLPGMPGTVSGSTVMQGTVNGTNVGATRQIPIFYDRNGEVYHANAEGGKSVWYVWYPPVTPGTVEFSTGGTSFDASRSTFNTLLEAYDVPIVDNIVNNAIAVISIASNNNVTTSDLTSLVSFKYKPDHAYVIAVDGYKGATGFIALHWKVKLQVTPATVPQVMTKIYPAITCSRDSDQSSSICKASYDAATHYHILHVFGTGFTTDSQVRINGTPLSGFDLNGTAINGFTALIKNANGMVTELVAHIPPSPSFDSVNVNDINVITPGSSGASTATEMSMEAVTTPSTQSNTGKEPTVTLKNATIPFHQTRTVCGHLDFFGGGETCIDFTNYGFAGNKDVTVDPAFFELFAYCSTLFPGKDPASFEQRAQCSATNGYGAEKLLQQLAPGFSINPQEAIDNGILTVTSHVNVSAVSVLSGGIDLQMLVAASTVLASDNAGILSENGLGVISNDGNSIKNASTADLVAPPGGALVAQGGGNLITNDGGTLITNDGGTIRFIAPDKGLALNTLSDDLRKGSGGWFVVRSSGNTNPVYTSTANDDGSTDGKLAVTFDGTSNPPSQDLVGLVFAVALNPAVVQFDSASITVNKSAGVAALDLTRTGDMSVPIAVQYTTSDDTATAGSDYQDTSGNLFFAEGETKKQITVPLVNTPSSVAPPLIFKLIIGNALGGAILMPNVASVTVLSFVTGCAFTLSSVAASLSASSGTGSVSFTAAGSDCAWTATSNVDWITITSGSSGSGNGTVVYAVAANSSISSRIGTMTIAGQTFAVTQAGIMVTLTAALLPSSARAPGAGGAFYTTDLIVANVGTTPTTFAVKFLGNNADGRGGPEKSFPIGAGASTTFSDVLGSVFGLTADYGAIRITSPSDSVRAIAQTSTPGFGGTFGQSVPAARPEDLITGGSPRSILAVREDASFRTNLILANATEDPLDVDVTLVADSGAILGTAAKRFTLPPLGMTQVTRVVRILGVTTNVSGARLVVSTPSIGKSFAAYASAIDNVTNDPRTLLPVGPIVGARPSPDYWIVPSSARAPGAGGAFYTTDLTVAYTNAVSARFTLKFLGNNMDGRGGPETTFDLGPQKSVTYTDVLGSVFQRTSDYGAIRVASQYPSSDSNFIGVLAQTSTPGFGGTFGQSVPAVTAADLIRTGTARSILAVEEDVSFRTNLILTNATEAALDVDVQLISTDGVVLATKRYPLAPLGMTQVTKVVRDMGIAANLSGARLVISTPTTSGAFAAYASAIDNMTNDPRTLLPR